MNIINFEELNSTNAYAKDNLNNLKNFDVITANSQTAGYGQWGRKWINTGVDNIYMTIILKPKKMSDCFTNIVRYTAICLCHVLEKYGVNPKIKEPNDVLINNKKIAGILAESITKGDYLKGIVIGIGINLNTNQKTLEKINQSATSLNLEINRTIDKNIFTNEFLQDFEKNYFYYTQKEINLNSFL